MSNLGPEDLGKGFTLSFQKAPNGDVRAVVKNFDGKITVRGPVVPETNAAVSKQQAVLEHLSANMAPETYSAPRFVTDEYDDDGEYGEEED